MRPVACNKMGLIQSVMQRSWIEFFTVFGFMFNSDFVTTITPCLLVVFFAYRVFGPKDQGLSFGQSGAAELERRAMVDESTYGGGHNAHICRNRGAVFDASASDADDENKKNR